MEKLTTLRPDGGKVIIAIDAIDECQLPNFALELDELAGRLVKFAGQVRVVAACKLAEWPRFALVRGEPSRLESLSFRPTQQGLRSDLLSPPGIRLEQFDVYELEKAVKTMSNWIGREIEPLPGDLREQCRTAYFLHMVARVRLGSESWPPSRHSGSLHSLFFRDLARRIDPDGRPELTEAVLVRVAERCWTNATNTGYPSADLTDLAATNGRRILSLFDRGVLQGEVNEATFYFQPFFLWLVAERVLNLQKLDGSEFLQRAQVLQRNGLGGELLHAYLANASVSQREVLNKHEAGRARVYLSLRDDLIRREFTGMRDVLEPFWPESGMLVCPKDRMRAFFRRRPGEQPIVFVDDMRTGVPREYVGRVFSIRGRFPDWIEVDPQACAVEELFGEIKNVAESGAWLQETEASAAELARALWRCLGDELAKIPQYNRPLSEMDVSWLREQARFGYALEQSQSEQIEAALGFRPSVIAHFQGGLVGVSEQRGARQQGSLDTTQLKAIRLKALELGSTDVSTGADLGWPRTEKADAFGALFRTCQLLVFYGRSLLRAERFSPHRFARRERPVEEVVLELKDVAPAADELVELVLRDCLPNFRASLRRASKTTMYVGPDRDRLGDLTLRSIVMAGDQTVDVLPGPWPDPSTLGDVGWGITSVMYWTDSVRRGGAPSLWQTGHVGDSIRNFVEFTPIRNIAHQKLKTLVVNELIRRVEQDERIVIRAWVFYPKLRTEQPIRELTPGCFSNLMRRQAWELLLRYPGMSTADLLEIMRRFAVDPAVFVGTQQELAIVANSGGLMPFETPDYVREAAIRLKAFADEIYGGL